MPGQEKYTKLAHGIIVGALESGLSRQGASGIARITSRTLRNWLGRGREGEEPYATLLLDVEAAEAKVEGEMVQQVRQSAKRGEFRAAAFWLERRRKKEWDPKHEQVADNKPTVVNIAVTGPSKVEVDPEDAE